ncbi:MAG: questin oxidase family protein [Acidimicrobiales bacterium]
MAQNFNPALQELLDEELATDPTTVRGLTNHLPMALVAKERLGADADELVRFAELYASRIQPLDEPGTRLDESTWRSAIGDYSAAAELREYFVRSVNDLGPEDALRTHLPPLLAGISGAAFHGVIRLAYAIEVASPSRIAAGLAYLAEVGTPLKPLANGAFTSDDPVAVLNELSRSPDVPVPPRGVNITESMRAVAHCDLFDTAVSSLEITRDTDAALAQMALHLYASTNDFTALHGVTGFEAIMALRPWVDEGELLSRYAFQALVAAYLSIGAPALWSSDRLDEFVGANTSDATAVASIAAFHDDEHVAKLVYTAQRSWGKTGDPLYLAVAARQAFTHA